MNGQIDYQSNDYSNKYSNQNTFYSSSHQPNITVHHNGQYQQQQYNFNQQYTNYYPSQYEYSFSQMQNQQISSVQSNNLAQAGSITPPPSTTNTPTPLYPNSSHYHQLLTEKKNKNIKTNRCLTNLLTKKENEDFHKNEEEDEEDEDLSDEDEEDEDDSRFDSIYKNKKQSDLDTENDYEIKHNCLNEQGAYMNSLFNSPSSLSSDSGKGKRFKKQDAMIVTKMERSDVSEVSLTQYGQENQSSSQQQHINNMINSYNLAGIMNDYDLVNLPLRELNKRLRFLPKQMAYNMKKRRRTLKNRKYAQNCRSKRLEQKSEMEIQNSQLKVELQRLNKLTEKLQQENNYLRSYINSNSAKSLDDILDNSKNQVISSMCHSDSNSCGLSSSNTPLTPTTPTNCNQLTQLLSLPPTHYNSLHPHQNSFNNIHITK